MSLKTLKVTTIVLMTALSCPTSADASYRAPVEKEKYILLCESWKIVENSSPDVAARQPEQHFILATHGPLRSSNVEFSLDLENKGRRYSFPVNMFTLAHHTSSNSICSGNYVEVMQKYLRNFETKTPKEKALVLLSSTQKDGVLTVAGIWDFKSYESWDQATQEGSKILDLSAEKVRLLGSKKAYDDTILRNCKEQWKLIEGRRTNFVSPNK